MFSGREGLFKTCCLIPTLYFLHWNPALSLNNLIHIIERSDSYQWKIWFTLFERSDSYHWNIWFISLKYLIHIIWKIWFISLKDLIHIIERSDSHYLKDMIYIIEISDSLHWFTSLDNLIHIIERSGSCHLKIWFSAVCVEDVFICLNCQYMNSLTRYYKPELVYHTLLFSQTHNLSVNINKYSRKSAQVLKWNCSSFSDFPENESWHLNTTEYVMTRQRAI